MPTLQDNLDRVNPNNHPADLQALRDPNGDGFGALLAGLIPREIVRTSLTSQAAHVEPEAGVILALSDGTDEYLIAPVTAGTPLAKGALANGVATVGYDVNGVATITFEGVKTAYTVVKMVLPAGMGDALAANL
jgi:hypothetical protein